jgi:hypothetical protein
MKRRKLTLYHFTSTTHLPFILKEGLTKGDVPVSPFTGFNGVWFTTCRTIDSQAGMLRCGVDKTQVRITAEIAESNKNLVKWSVLATVLNIDRDWYRILDKTGGYGSNTWYVYTDVLSPDMFKKVEYRISTSSPYQEFDTESDFGKSIIEKANKSEYGNMYQRYGVNMLNLCDKLSILKVA